MQSMITRRFLQLASLVVLMGSLAACGGGGSGGEVSANAMAPSDPAAPSPGAPAPAVPTLSGPPATSATPETPTIPATPGLTPPSLGNHAPTISGAAITSVMSGNAYNFVPGAADADGDHLQFAISSKPAWATFDTATGRLWGIPTSASLGSYEEIVISVTDGKVSTNLAQFAIVVEVSTPSTRNVHISWQPPTTNSDGTALTDLSGYRILYGTQPGVYTSSVTVNNAGLASFTIENLQSGKKYYFAMVAVNGAGAESDNSQEVVVNLT